MKIYILPVPPKLQPASQGLLYPAHNKDYGVEQDFAAWLGRQPGLLTADAGAADWHYLPVFWTRWHINHNFAEQNEGIEELKTEVGALVIDDHKTFTISQFDGGTLVDAGATLVFTASRTTNQGIDIPLLCSPHRRPPFIRKKFLASFNGSFGTHPLRTEMKAALAGNPDVVIGGNLPTRFYKRWLMGKQFNLNTLASYVALCPRGTSCNSFRFFEAMQLGVAPCLIGDKDVRPFKRFIPWETISYYAETVHDLVQLLEHLDKNEALKKGDEARKYWKNELFYGKWCKYVLKELEEYQR